MNDHVNWLYIYMYDVSFIILILLGYFCPFWSISTVKLQVCFCRIIKYYQINSTVRSPFRPVRQTLLLVNLKSLPRTSLRYCDSTYQPPKRLAIFVIVAVPVSAVSPGGSWMPEKVPSYYALYERRVLMKNQRTEEGHLLTGVLEDDVGIFWITAKDVRRHHHGQIADVHLGSRDGLVLHETLTEPNKKRRELR